MVLSSLALTGCSPGTDYPPLFPTSHDQQSHTDSTLNPVQVQQATDDLITERNHLSAEAQSQQAAPPASGNPPANAASAKPAKKAAVKKAAPAQHDADGTLTAGAETK